LNCVNGPTPDPCGTCDACVEIAEGRDIDVLEIDAATHTQVDNVREVIISGLAIAPVRNRYKIFIIDEVHQLSNSSFNALLKSIEEPPPHVVFMMATTELDKIPETVLSRSQVYEFRTISAKAIAEQLRRIVDAEGIAVGDEALQLIARDAEGSMRDAQSKLDQVIAFTGRTIATDDVATVLGLVGRDLLLDAVQAVAADDAPAAFTLAGRAVEQGYDLRAAGEGERDLLKALAARFSREDLLRAFDLLTRAESEIRTAAQPRYHLEMALLRWIYIRKLTPIEDLLAGGSSTPVRGASATAIESPRPRPAPPAPIKPSPPSTPVAPGAVGAPGSDVASPARNLKDAFLAEIRKNKVVFYNTVVAQAQKIEMDGDRVTFTFLPNQRILRDAFEEKRSWLESIAQQATGRKVSVGAAAAAVGVPGEADAGDAAKAAAAAADKKNALREQALADAGVQAMLEVFPAEIRDVEEM
jgi:DNA polymerase-3 subunit gamma/tau